MLAIVAAASRDWAPNIGEGIAELDEGTLFRNYWYLKRGCLSQRRPEIGSVFGILVMSRYLDAWYSSLGKLSKSVAI